MEHWFKILAHVSEPWEAEAQAVTKKAADSITSLQPLTTDKVASLEASSQGSQQEGEAS